MKRITSLSLLLISMISTNAQALKWASIFVAWEGKVYEGVEDKFIEDSETGKKIGKVENKASEETGSYWGICFKPLSEGDRVV